MKTVKELCLGVAVAGVVAGAGSVLGCSVAAADPTAADPAASDGTRETAGPARTARDAQPARDRNRSGDRTAATGRGGSEDGAGRTPSRVATRLSTPDPDRNDSPRSAATVAATAPASAVGTAERIVDDPVGAVDGAVVAVDETPADTPAAAVPGSGAVAGVGSPTAARVVAAVPATPANPLLPVTPLPLPLPTPVLPVAPASAVTVSASARSGSTAGRSANATASQVGDPDPTHILLIGTDGTNLSKILEYAYDDPNSGFRILMDEGVTGATSIVGHTTISGPSWSTILTGAWDSKTGVINNLFDPRPYDSWPTVFNLIEYNQPAVNTAVVANWRYINDIGEAGGYPADVNQFVEFSNSWEDTDDIVAAQTIDLINSASAAGSSFIFSYQVAVDEAGHAYGGGSTQYRDAVINTSENIADIMAAVDAWETATGEEWTVIVTTDHGHQQSVGFGHGFQSPNETSSFVIFDLEGDGANDGTQNLAYTTADITPTIVNLFGIGQRSDFDGVPLPSKATSIVSPVNLKTSLNDAIAMYGYPDIGTDIALGVRTVFTSIPYFLNGFVDNITGLLQDVVDADIFLISALAGIAEFAVQIVGDVLVVSTQALARVVATLTGSGVIPPSDPPLPAPPAATLLPAAILV